MKEVFLVKKWPLSGNEMMVQIQRGVFWKPKHSNFQLEWIFGNSVRYEIRDKVNKAIDIYGTWKWFWDFYLDRSCSWNDPLVFWCHINIATLNLGHFLFEQVTLNIGLERNSTSSRTSRDFASLKWGWIGQNEPVWSKMGFYGIKRY